MAEESTKYLLGEDRIPRAWYNIAPDMPVAPPPPLHPGTHQPIGPDDLAPLFPMSLIAQEVSTERYVEIPDPVRDVYRLWRPTPALPRAAAGAGAGPAGRRAHLLQVRGHQPGRQPQAETRPCRRVLQRRGGREADHHRDRGRPVGQLAGVWPAPSTASSSRLHGQGLLRAEALTAGADGDLGRDLPCPAEPDTNARPADPGRAPGFDRLARHRHLEAVEDAAMREDTKYSLGSVLNHVLMHQR